VRAELEPFLGSHDGMLTKGMQSTSSHPIYLMNSSPPSPPTLPLPARSLMRTCSPGPTPRRPPGWTGDGLRAQAGGKRRGRDESKVGRGKRSMGERSLGTFAYVFCIVLRLSARALRLHTTAEPVSPSPRLPVSPCLSVSFSLPASVVVSIVFPSLPYPPTPPTPKLSLCHFVVYLCFSVSTCLPNPNSPRG
jgi:hypothetical protein